MTAALERALRMDTRAAARLRAMAAAPPLPPPPPAPDLAAVNLEAQRRAGTSPTVRMGGAR